MDEYKKIYINHTYCSLFLDQQNLTLFLFFCIEFTAALNNTVLGPPNASSNKYPHDSGLSTAFWNNATYRELLFYDSFDLDFFRGVFIVDLSDYV